MQMRKPGPAPRARQAIVEIVRQEQARSGACRLTSREIAEMTGFTEGHIENTICQMVADGTLLLDHDKRLVDNNQRRIVHILRLP